MAIRALIACYTILKGKGTDFATWTLDDFFVAMGKMFLKPEAQFQDAEQKAKCAEKRKEIAGEELRNWTPKSFKTMVNAVAAAYRSAGN